MPTKPTDKPTFATSANYAAGAFPWSATPTKKKPVAGRIASGFDPKQRPPAQNINWLLNNIGQWIDYLDDSAFADIGMAAHDLELDPSDGDDEVGNIGIVRITVTADGPFALRSMVDAPEGTRVLITNASSNTAPNNYAATVPKKRQITIAHMDGAGTAKKFYFPGIDSGDGVNAGLYQTLGAIRSVMLDPGASILVQKDDDKDAWVVIGMCGCRRDSVVCVSAAVGYAYPDDTTVGRSDDGRVDFTTGTDDFLIHIPMSVGSIISGFRVYMDKNTDDTGTPFTAKMQVQRHGGETDGTAASNDDDAPGETSLEVAAGTDYLVVDGQSSVKCRLTPTGGAVGGTDQVYSLEVYYWTPPIP